MGLLFPAMPVLKMLVVPAMVVLVVAFALIWRARVRYINRAAGVVSLRVSRRERKQA